MDWEPGPRDPKTPVYPYTQDHDSPCVQMHLARLCWTVARGLPMALSVSLLLPQHSVIPTGPQEKHALAFKPSAHRLLCPSQSHCPAFVQLSQLPGLPSFPPTAPSPPPAEGKSMAEKEPEGQASLQMCQAGWQEPGSTRGGFPGAAPYRRSPPLFRVWPAEAQIPRRCSVLDPASRSWS